MKLHNRCMQLTRRQIILPTLLAMVFHKKTKHMLETTDDYKTVKLISISNREPVIKNEFLRTSSFV